MLDTVTSRREPVRAKGGSSAVTITAATFFTFIGAGLTVSPGADQEVGEGLDGELGLILVAGAIQAHHHAVAQQLVAPHALEAGHVPELDSIFLSALATSAPKRARAARNRTATRMGVS